MPASTGTALQCYPYCITAREISAGSQALLMANWTTSPTRNTAGCPSTSGRANLVDKYVTKAHPSAHIWRQGMLTGTCHHVAPQGTPERRAGEILGTWLQLPIGQQVVPRLCIGRNAPKVLKAPGLFKSRDGHHQPTGTPRGNAVSGWRSAAAGFPFQRPAGATTCTGRTPPPRIVPPGNVAAPKFEWVQ